MTFDNKTYTKPQLTVHGNVEAITQNSNQMNTTDVPMGTQITGETTLNDITS